MLNYGNLNDNEFESLCRDIMSKKLKKDLRKFAPGKDGGIDLVDDLDTKNIIVQVKHYTKTSNSGLINSLKKELPKVKKLNPSQYYICCSRELTPDNITEIYEVFRDYMDSDKNIVTLTEIDEFLSQENNADVLRNNYKLWIESTNILRDLLSKDILIDCEALLYGINEEVKFFVETSAYREALRCLSKNNVLFIIGDPGVGKTTTSKMLILYYASIGYKVRYTTDGTDLSSLKKALSQSPEEKEVILLDDCLGQAYFNMKETQCNELLTLVKYISMSPNKMLILNSRVTIYKEARVKSLELIQSLGKEEFKLHIINMTEIPLIEKAQILYNHIYFNGIDDDYYYAIKENQNYKKIVAHKNYNPRIIEFVCNPRYFSHIPAKNYVGFILENLNEPFHIWKNEYEERLSQTDRILLLTLYSLTNTTILMSFLEKCYTERLKRIQGIDLSINQFERSMKRLEHAFVKIVDHKGQKMVSVYNPSINDFLAAYLKEDTFSYQQLQDSCCSILQLKRLLKEKAFDKKIREIFEDGSVVDYLFEDEVHKYQIITYYVAKLRIMKGEYKEYIQKYIMSVSHVDIYEKWAVSAIQIFTELMDSDIREFYELDMYIKNLTIVQNILSKFTLPNLVDVLSMIDFLFSENREQYLRLVEEIVKEAIEDYTSYISAYDYGSDLDFDSIVEGCYCYDPDGGDYDEDEAASEIEEAVRDLVVDEVEDCIKSLPKGVLIDDSYVNTIDISVYDSNWVVSDCLEQMIDYDEDRYIEKHITENNKMEYEDIDLIFK